MHRATARFWRSYRALPERVRMRADRAFALLRENPQHPSLHLKKAGVFWSARVDVAHRAIAVPDGDDFIWVWVGSHDEYNRLIGSR